METLEKARKKLKEETKLENKEKENKVRGFIKAFLLYFCIPFITVFWVWYKKKWSMAPRIAFTVWAIIALLIGITGSIAPTDTTPSASVPTTNTTDTTKPKEAPAPPPVAKTPEEIKAEEEKAAADKAAAEAKSEKDKYEAWVKGQFSLWDGSHKALVELIKENLNDKKSFEHDTTTYIDNGDHLIVKMRYRAKNGFGAMILQNVTAKADYKTNTVQIISTND